MMNDDPQQAGKELGIELRERLNGPPDAVLLFAAPTYLSSAALEGMRSTIPECTSVIGCTTYGEIGSDEVLSNSMTAMGLRSNDVAFKTFHVRDVSADHLAAGEAFGRQLKDFAPDAVLLFSDSIMANATRFLRGIQSVVGRNLPILGGLAADYLKYSRNFECHGREVFSGGAVGLGIKGPIKLVSGGRSGWTPVGATRRCTKVEHGTLVLEIDGRPALDLYEDYLGDRAKEMPAVSVEFPLAVVDEELLGSHSGETEIVARGIKEVVRERRALRLSADIPEGCKIRMTRATKDDLLKAARDVEAALCAEMPDPSLAFIFNCAGRKMVLGHRHKLDVQPLFDQLGPSVPKVGFFCNGEYSPVRGTSTYHEFTFSMALLKA